MIPPLQPAVRLKRSDCLNIFQKIWLKFPRASEKKFRTIAETCYPSKCYKFNGQRQKIYEEELTKFLLEVQRLRKFSRSNH